MQQMSYRLSPQTPHNYVKFHAAHRTPMGENAPPAILNLCSIFGWPV
jgi:hypothetical protein